MVPLLFELEEESVAKMVGFDIDNNFVVKEVLIVLDI
jgi:hypothetical protein